MCVEHGEHGLLLFGVLFWLTVLWSCRSVSCLRAKLAVDEFVDDEQTSAMIYSVFSASMPACIDWGWRRAIKPLLIVLNKYHLLWYSLSRRLDSVLGFRDMPLHCRTAMRWNKKKKHFLYWQLVERTFIQYLNGVESEKPFMTRFFYSQSVGLSRRRRCLWLMLATRRLQSWSCKQHDWEHLICSPSFFLAHIQNLSIRIVLALFC